MAEKNALSLLIFLVISQGEAWSSGLEANLVAIFFSFVHFVSPVLFWHFFHRIVSLYSHW